MYRADQTQQFSLNDMMMNADDQVMQALETSRAKLVGDFIYPNIDESKFACLFSDKASRPNIPIPRYVCALILKQLYGLSDEVFLEFLRCGAMNFRYALHTTGDDKQPLSESSLRRFRKYVCEYNKEHKCDLIKEEYLRISRLMALDMGVLGGDPSDGDDDRMPIIMRMDSMEVEAHAKAMSRLEILYTTVLICIRFLLKKDLQERIPKELSHYLEADDKNRVIYHRRREDKENGKNCNRLGELVGEMFLVRKTLEDTFTASVLAGVEEYSVLCRVLDEQTKTGEDGSVIPRENGEISPDSVQNPFDTTVTYRYKNGQHHGFAMNVVEAVDGEGNGIIIHASVGQNTRDDRSLAEEYVEYCGDDGPEQRVVLDGGYDSEKLRDMGEEKNIKFQTTSLVGSQPYDIDADFKLNDEGTKIISCPEGREPVSCTYSKKTGVINARMPENCCESCPHFNDCNVYQNKRGTESNIHLSRKMRDRSIQARALKTDEGKANARTRNGVEGIMSVMRRMYRIDSIPQFGLERVKSWIWTILLSYNLVKYQKYLAAKAEQLALQG